MTTTTTTETIEDQVRRRLLGGADAAALAAELGLETSEDDDGVAIVLPGAWACDGDVGDGERYWPGLSPEEAAREYSDSPDWEPTLKTWWYQVHTWRSAIGLVDGEIQAYRVDRESHSIEVAPIEPAAEVEA